MNEISSQGIGGAVSQLQVLEIYSFLRGYYAYMKSGLLSWRNAGVEDRTNKQT